MLGGAVFVTRLGAAGLDLAPTWAAFAVAALIAGLGPDHTADRTAGGL
jgi:hypothetical protein